VFENRVLKKIFGNKGELKGRWRKQYNKELHDLSFSPNIIRVIRSRRVRGVERMSRLGENKNAFRV
jgi:hypothetical protein